MPRRKKSKPFVFVKDMVNDRYFDADTDSLPFFIYGASHPKALELPMYQVEDSDYLLLVFGASTKREAVDAVNEEMKTDQDDDYSGYELKRCRVVQFPAKRRDRIVDL